MKKLFAMALSLILTVSSVAVGFAADPVLPTEPEVLVGTKVEVGLGNEIDEDEYAEKLSYETEDFSEKYDLKATIDMTKVTEKIEALITSPIVDSEDDAKNVKITGQFDITIELSDEIFRNVGTFYNDAKFELSGEASFDDIFVMPEEKDVVLNTAKDVLTFTVKVADGVVGSKIYDFDNDESLLGDEITLVCLKAIWPKEEDTYTITGKVEGETILTKADDSKAIKVPYKFEDAEAKLTIDEEEKSSGGSGGGRPSGMISTGKNPVISTEKFTVDYVLGTGAVAIGAASTSVPAGSVINFPANVTREGFLFTGWLVNGKNYTEATYTVSGDTVITAKWINLNVPADLNGTDHTAYIKGYPDGNVRPEAYITREEVATIFYRLLTDAKRAEIETTTNNFSDVKADSWSNTAISTLANGGYINGYPDGTFRPTANISRAEFVTIAAKFSTLGDGVTAYYSDVKGHWAEKYIAAAADTAWVSGYDDGTFKPDATITRAEVMRIVNNVLVRYTDEQNLNVEGIVLFPDNASSAWYYYDVIEASNGHDYTRREDGYHEAWSAIKATELKN